jgi:hypothetical protein
VLLYRPRHARPSLLTRPRNLVGVAAALGLAVFAVAVTSEATGAHARAAVPAAVPVVQHDAGAASGGGPDTAGAVLGAVSDPARKTGDPQPGGLAPASLLASSGIPVTALAAYERAAAREAQLAPACGLTWPLLAGIGRVESDHGRFAGAVLHADGISTPPIIGIPLDGHGTALIRDTDGAALDGDAVYDRAVGPMQFIPSTWAGWGVDGNNDGRVDPFNIFDAAAAAADYLCAAGGDLTTAGGQITAILSYNHSYDYVRLVMSLERLYASGAGIVVPVAADPRRVKHAVSHLPPVDAGTAQAALAAPTESSAGPSSTHSAASTTVASSSGTSSASAPTSTSSAPSQSTASSATPSDTASSDTTSSDTTTPDSTAPDSTTPAPDPTTSDVPTTASTDPSTTAASEPASPTGTTGP